MALAINELQVIHSGGAANEDPAADLGGAISTAANKRVQSQTSTAPANITGVTINDAYGNPEGVGQLFYTNATNELGWKPNGASTFYGAVISGSGEYLIGSSAGYLVVDVVSGSLPGSDQTDNITIANNQHNVFPQVSEADSLLGIVEYRCLYILNTNGTDTATDVKLWIPTNTPGGDIIEIGLGSSGLNGTEQTIADGETAPTGVTFSSPSSLGAALSLGNIPAGQHYAFWQRRTVPQETRGTVISNGAVLAIAATI